MAGQGLRKIEWIGAKSIFADPVFEYRRAAGMISEQEMRILRTAASKSIFRVDGRTSRILKPGDPDGLSKEYQWGPDPGSYVQKVKPEDWYLISICRSAREFRDITDGIPADPPIELPGELVVVKEESFRSLRDFLKAVERDA